jgi:two-component system LytT family response regulator
LKPFSKERFARAIEKFIDVPHAATQPSNQLLESLSASPQQRQRVVVKTAGKIKIIPVEEIQYLEAADDYVRINTKEGGFLKNRTMAHFEKILDDQQFVRTHRSYIVNIQMITRIDPYEKENYLAILKDGKQMPVSRSGYAKLKQVLGL